MNCALSHCGELGLSIRLTNLTVRRRQWRPLFWPGGAGPDRTSAACYEHFRFCVIITALEGCKQTTGQEAEKPRPAFSWEPQILLHTNFALITWTVPDGET